MLKVSVNSERRLILRKKLISAGVLGAALLATLTLAGCDAEPEQQFTLVGDEQAISGTVMETEMTLCGPSPEHPGVCAGTLALRPADGGEAERITLEITRAVPLKQGEHLVMLSQLEGNQVKATYRASEEGPKVATSVVVAP
ncbi:hypothetical protein FHJ31_18020 [Pseudomonas sp. Fig-3]|uniref:hypothetical protein n=1 Tax=unclassified Pseudomonas TaxID=196821 RepID=UPI001112406D|nr:MULTISPECIES: hypothetical protein [unclassified Pseudomonas]TNB81440.1 hypothetical protein FHJ31_18020 [Pseudomonas sp. Fig-3]